MISSTPSRQIDPITMKRSKVFQHRSDDDQLVSFLFQLCLLCQKPVDDNEDTLHELVCNDYILIEKSHFLKKNLVSIAFIASGFIEINSKNFNIKMYLAL
jgi:hypothetical protein